MKKLFNKNLYITVASVLLFLLTWQLVATSRFVNTDFTGSPLGILNASYNLLGDRTIYPILLNSLGALVAGITLAIVVGIVGGIIIGTNNVLFQATKIYVYALDSIPKVVLLPLIVIWLGVTFKSKILLVFIMAVVPVLISTIESSRLADRKLMEMASSFSANKLTIIKDVIFPSILPSIFSSSKIAVGRGVTGLIVAEFFGLGTGIGYLISFYGMTFQTDKVMFFVILLVIFSLLTVKAVGVLEKKIILWENV